MNNSQETGLGGNGFLLLYLESLTVTAEFVGLGGFFGFFFVYLVSF